MTQKTSNPYEDPSQNEANASEKDGEKDASHAPKTVREALLKEEEEKAKIREKSQELKATVFDGVRLENENPVQPIQLKSEDRFCFSCHKGLSCWNSCCYGADITLTPLDILRLSRFLNVTPSEFLRIFTLPAFWGDSGLPVAKLRAEGKDGKGACVFLDPEEGCTVYEERPVNCRYYPLGMAKVKMKGHEKPEDFYFLVREAHCKGHEEAKEQTVAEFREEQGVVPYDDVNRGWIEILMKMASWNVLGGPYGQAPSEQTRKMFFMATTDVQAFRRFVFETKFLQTYDVDPELVERLKEDDTLLLQLAFDWMKTVLFNDGSLPMREEVLQDAIAKARSGEL